MTDTGMKQCARCKKTKGLDQYCTIPSRGNRPHSYCRDCSRDLGREAWARKKAGICLRSDVARQRLSVSLRARYESGTRKPNPEGTAQKIAQRQKVLYATGSRVVASLTKEDAKRMRALADPEKVAAACRATARLRTGQLNPDGPSARGTGHWKAKYWELLSPDRRTYRFVNLSEFVRNHSDMFDPRDVEWIGAQCRAVKRLSDLFSNKGKRAPLSWKGWRAIRSDESSSAMRGEA